MKIMTLNLHTYQEEDQLKKFNRIATTIFEEKIDIVCFCQAAQTFNSPIVKAHIRYDNAVKLICEMVNALYGEDCYQYVWALSHYGFKIYEEGIAIMSRYPIYDVETRYISQTQDTFTYKSRNILKASIDYHGTKINVFSCQLGWEDDKYEPFDIQFNNLHQWVCEQKDVFCISAGDFGNDVRSKCYSQVIGSGYIDQYLEAKKDGIYDETFINPRGFTTVSFKSLRLDYIFSINKPYHAKEAKRFFMDEEHKVSDHMAVMVDIDIK